MMPIALYRIPAQEGFSLVGDGGSFGFGAFGDLVGDGQAIGCDVGRKVCGGPGFRDYQPYGRRFCAGVFSSVFSMPEAWGAVADAVAGATTPVNEIGDSLNEPVATWMLKVAVIT